LDNGYFNIHTGILSSVLLLERVINGFFSEHKIKIVVGYLARKQGYLLEN